MVRVYVVCVIDLSSTVCDTGYDVRAFQSLMLPEAHPTSFPDSLFCVRKEPGDEVVRIKSPRLQLHVRRLLPVTLFPNTTVFDITILRHISLLGQGASSVLVNRELIAFHLDSKERDYQTKNVFVT